jgi:methionine biosynthesis protein MetW
MIREGATVLDLGCGDGALLAHLKQACGVSGYGVEKDDQKVLSSVKNGINVIQADLEQGLSGFADGAFDYVVLSLTLQTVHETETIIQEMLRVGKEVIVTFPNFGFWRHRVQIFFGKTPVSKELPYQWYDTPNVHVLTISDFEIFCDTHSVRILEKIVLNEQGARINVRPNLFGALAIYRFNRRGL